MKGLLSILCIVLSAILLLSACGQTKPADSNSSEPDSTEASQTPVESTAPGTDTTVVTDGKIKTAGQEINASDLEHKTDSNDAPVVWFTSDISPEGLLALYKVMNWTPTGNVAVKVSTGESESTNYLRPALIKDLVEELDGTIVECMTAYGGVRSKPESHHKIAEDHGFTTIAPFDLMDEDGEIEIPYNGKLLERAYVGSHVENYGSFLVLSHFKGHAMAGYGGALKNVAIGISSVSGKVYIHSGGTRTSGSIMGEQTAFLESLAEASKAIIDYMGEEKMIYISVMNRLSVDCDCDANPAEPDMHDIGILASYDPVALDQACIDFVYAAPDSGSLVTRIESRNGIHTLEYAEEIGLGSREYRLIVTP